MGPAPNTNDPDGTAPVVKSPSLEDTDGTRPHKGENPYLIGLSKKTRGLKKKLDRIIKTECLAASGKVSAGSSSRSCLPLLSCFFFPPLFAPEEVHLSYSIL